MQDDQALLNDQFAARMSALEFIVEVFASNQLKEMRNAQQFIDLIRDRLAKPRPHVGGPVEIERLQRMNSDVQEFGTHLANKIEARWREIAG